MRATRWVSSPIESHSRVDASLHALLGLIGLSPEEAARYHGHSAKRFALCVTEAAGSLDPATHGQDAGRFSMSAAQMRAVEPTEAMLHQHTVRCTVLPARYANQARVEKAFERVCDVHRVVRAAAVRASRGYAISRERGFAHAFAGL